MFWSNSVVRYNNSIKSFALVCLVTYGYCNGDSQLTGTGRKIGEYEHGDRGLFFICGKRFPIVSPLQSTRGEFVVTPGIFLQKIIGSLKTSQSEKVKFGNFFEFIVNWFIEFMQISRDGLIAKQSF